MLNLAENFDMLILNAPSSRHQNFYLCPADMPWNYRIRIIYSLFFDKDSGLETLKSSLSWDRLKIDKVLSSIARFLEIEILGFIELDLEFFWAFVSSFV